MMDRIPGLRRLRVRILLTVFAGVLPLLAWWAWTVTVAERAGETVLRARLETSLEDVARQMSRDWTSVRSALTDLASAQQLRALLAADPPGFSAGEDGPATELQWEGLLPDGIRRVTLRAADGETRARWSESGSTMSNVLPAVRQPVRPSAGAEIVGWLEVELDASLLLPRNVINPTVSGVVFTVLDADGDGGTLPLGLTADLLAQDRFTWGGEEWVVERRALGDPELVLAMAGAVSPFSAPLEEVRRRAWLGGLASVVLGALIALWVSGRLAGSLERLARAADRVSGGALDVWVTPEGPDEVARVGQAFNQMVESLRESTRRAARREGLARVGEFAASLAHEVRNPLTSTRLDLERCSERIDPETTEGRLVRRAMAELSRLEGSVAGALRLARSGRVDRRPLDPDRILRDAVMPFEAACRERGIRLESDASWTGRPALGDPEALRRLLVNLLENAVAATDEGGYIRVRVAEEGGLLVFEVRDDGSGMDPEQMERATELLYTTRPGGTGLGLAIAQRIAVAHGGTLEIESARGRGTSVELRLPVIAGKR